MSDTIVDMPKVTQMLDSGWEIRLYLGPMGSYEVRARHTNPQRMYRTYEQLEKYERDRESVMDHHVDDGWLMTDDFTPEQALTRMAYKVHGEIL